MSLDTSKTSKIAKTIAIVARGNAAYMMMGATQVPETQMQGRRMGQEYDFDVDDLTAAEFSGTGSIADGISTRKVTLKVRNVGLKIDSNQTDRDLCLDDQKKLGEKAGIAIVKEGTKLTILDDLTSGAEVTIANADISKAIVKKAAQLSGENAARTYGFIAAPIMGEILGDKRENQPVSVESDFVNVKSWNNIDSMVTLSLPANSTGASLAATNTIVATTAVGSTVAATGAKAGKWYVWGGAVAVGVKDDVVKVAKGGVVDATAASSEVYNIACIRSEGAQAYGNAAKCLAGYDEIQAADGVEVAKSEVKKGSFCVADEYATAFVSGVGDKEAVKFVICRA